MKLEGGEKGICLGCFNLFPTLLRLLSKAAWIANWLRISIMRKLRPRSLWLWLLNWLLSATCGQGTSCSCSCHRNTPSPVLLLGTLVLPVALRLSMPLVPVLLDQTLATLYQTMSLLPFIVQLALAAKRQRAVFIGLLWRSRNWLLKTLSRLRSLLIS